MTATSIDRATVEIVNGTSRTYYYRVAAWQPEQFETCRGLLESEIERGPLDPGTTVRVMLAAFVERPDVPISIAFWDKPCGEGCQHAPVAAILVARSPVTPGAS